MPLVITLAVVSAVAVTLGLTLVIMSTAAHVVSSRPADHVTTLGLALGAAGIVVGLATLLVFAFTRGGRSTRGQGRPGRAAADRRHTPGHRRRAATSPGQDRDQAATDAAERGPDQPADDSRSRPRRGQVLNPTTLYSPRGLLDVPRDARASGSAGPAGAVPPPGSAGPQRAASPLESAGPPRAAPPPAGRTGAPRPWPQHQPAAYSAGPGWGPPPAARPPQQPVGPPRDRGRLRAAYPPRGALPLREAPPSQGSPPSRPAPPPRQAALPRDPSRAGAPMPPRGASHPGSGLPGSGHPGSGGRFGPGQGSAGARPPGGPGYPPPGGQWSAPPGIQVAGGPVPPGAPSGRHGTFDGGYAQVIRAADYPAPPSRIRPPDPGRPAGPERAAAPAGPAGPADADVFVYRDSGGQQDGPAAGAPVRDSAEHDTAYWYDLLAEDVAPRREETRGPFEPLVSSGGTSARPGPASAGTGPASTGQASGDDTAQLRARKLEIGRASCRERVS